MSTPTPLSSICRRIRHASLIFLILLLALAPAWAVPVRFRDAVAAMAAAGTNGQLDLSEPVFDAIGFDHKIRKLIPDWDKHSLIDKLEYLYYFAEEGKKGQGRLAIAKFAESVTLDYETFRARPEIRALLDGVKETPAVLTFVKPRFLKAVPPLPPELHDAVVAIASHVGKGSHVSSELLLRRAGLRSTQIYKIFKRADTIEEVIGAALANHNPRAQERMIRRMTEALVDQYPNAASDSRLKAYAPSPRPPKPPRIHLNPNGSCGNALKSLEREILEHL